MTWREATAYCESLGGHLVTITSQEEQTFIENLIKNGAREQYWIGATDEANEGVWRWVTGEPWNYENWATYEPSNYMDNEHYGQVYRLPNQATWMDNSEIGKWNDAPDNNTIDEEEDFFSPQHVGFICEWDAVSVSNKQDSNTVDVRPALLPSPAEESNKIIAREAYMEQMFTEFTVPDGVTAIEVDAFWGCKQLETIYIPASVTKIESYAFNNCKSLTDMYIYARNIELFDRTLWDDADDGHNNIRERIIIHGYKGSDVERWAKLYSFTFAALDSSNLDNPSE